MSHVTITVYASIGDPPHGHLDTIGDQPLAMIRLVTGGALLCAPRGVKGVAYLRELAAVATRLADQMETS